MTTQAIRDNAGWIYDRIRDAGLNPEKPLEALDTLVKAYLSRFEEYDECTDEELDDFEEFHAQRVANERETPKTEEFQADNSNYSEWIDPLDDPLNGVAVGGCIITWREYDELCK